MSLVPAQLPFSPAHASLPDPLMVVSGPLLMAYLACWVALYAHEIGHAAAARVLGVRIWGIQLGAGPTLFEGSIGGCRLRVGLFPVVGSVALLDADATAIGYRDLKRGGWRFEWVPGAWRAPLISAAGAVANLAAALLVVAYWSAAGAPPVGTPLGNLALYIFAANVSGYFNLLPCFSSDGVHLLAHMAAARRVHRPAARAPVS
jgi:membrane-associated protease RseP (regulator of RpoE activity)